MNLRGRCGFSLLELLVALALSSLVLVGVMMLATSMVKFQMDSIEQGSGTGGAVYAVQRLKKDLADATDLECPGSRCAATGHSNRGDVLAACTNWSVLGDPAAGGQRIDDNAPNETDCQSGSGNVKCFYYCVANAAAGPELMRYSQCSTTRAIPAPSCGAGGEVVVYGKPGFYRMDGYNYYFERDDGVSGAALHFIIGVGTPTVSGAGTGPLQTTPVSYKYNLRVGMSKSYTDTMD